MNEHLRIIECPALLFNSWECIQAGSHHKSVRAARVGAA